MGNAKTIEVGNKSDAPYLAFGDDSQFEDVLTYAFVIVRRTRLTKIESEISRLKKRFKIPHGIPIHCRVLFHHHPRHKAGLGHLTDEDARKIVAHAITILNETKCLIRYATGSLFGVQGIEKSTLELRHESDGTTVSLALKPEPKGVLGILMQMCFAVDPNGSQGPCSSQCEIFAAADPTKPTMPTSI